MKLRKSTFFLVLYFISIGYSRIYSQNRDSVADNLPEKWTYASEFVQTLPSDDLWWQSFNDKCLDTLIEMAITNNYDVQIALKRITMAKNDMRIVQSGYYPNLSIDAGWTKERSSGVVSDYYDLGLAFNWQIDLFGQITSQAKEKKSLWQASKAQYEGTMVTLCANVASHYINLRIWQAQYIVAQSHIKSQKQIMDITEARFKSGLASMLDVSQARSLYLNTHSSLSPLKANIEAQINSIATLLGIFPDSLPKEIKAPTLELPQPSTNIQVGVPAELIRRRPDIKEAEYNVASYAASIGIAKKDFLPSISINGNIGFKSNKIDGLFQKEAFGYSIMPKLSLTLFDGLNRNYRFLNAKEQLQIGIDNYNNTVMNAITEVENAMISYHYSIIETQELEKVNDEALNSLKLSVDLYKRGLTPFSNVLTSQQDYLQYNNSYVVSKGKSLLNLISLYQALGGGWEQ